ncbi:transposable element Tcb2 transposase [Trichonephila clavipes]|nr:transposable element Tcb2 transposase [Trichonephila clavipes]
MDWPAGSPDLKTIEHVWDFLGRRLAARTLPPVTIRKLRLALQDEWAAMPQQLIDTLILSMGRRCETCLAVRGIISPTNDRMFLAGHPSQGCFGLRSHCTPCYFFNQASFYPSDFSFRASTQQPPKCQVSIAAGASTQHPPKTKSLFFFFSDPLTSLIYPQMFFPFPPLSESALLNFCHSSAPIRFDTFQIKPHGCRCLGTHCVSRRAAVTGSGANKTHC